ncbi:MAG: hypothetical protein ACLQF1_03435 [Methyloceanibacter sp.]|jgi:hypothetical protein
MQMKQASVTLIFGGAVVAAVVTFSAWGEQEQPPAWPTGKD